MDTKWTAGLSRWKAGWKRTMLSTLLAFLVLTTGLSASPANAAGASGAQANFIVDPLSPCVPEAKLFDYPFQDPCVYLVSNTRTSIRIGFEPNTGDRGVWSDEHEFHIRWTPPGEREQSVNAGLARGFTFGNLRPGMTYRFAVQRCKKVTIGKDECTGWTVRHYSTRS